MTKEIDNLVVRVDAVITDEQYKECMAAVKSANEHISDLEQFAKDLLVYMDTDFCEECPVQKKCDNGEIETCVEVGTYVNLLVRAAKLGIEVNGDLPPYKDLLETLRRDYGLEVSWDGLREFWYIGLTDEEVTKRDAAAKDLGALHDELRDAIVEILGGRCSWNNDGVAHAHDVLDKAFTPPTPCQSEWLEYESKMDALLCRLTNGKYSKTWAYDIDQMESVVDSEYENLYAIDGETSDGYHTFNELYHHRAVLFSVIVRDHPELAWKSKMHHDGTMYDEMFIVGIETPQGQATYHYDIEPYWEMFGCKELERAPEWDGHTPDQAIERIATLGRRTCHNLKASWPSLFECDECGYSNDDMYYGSEWRFKFCPNCGAKVVDE